MALPVSEPSRGRLLPLFVELLRGARSFALWAAGPLERGWRRLTGRPALPPLWLRRHVGPVGRFESAARETAELIDRLGLVGTGSRVVDLGCGCGAMVPAIAERLGGGGSYLGVDVHPPSLAWCRRRWRADRRLRFESVAVRSPYGGKGGAAAAAFLPSADGSADFVLAKSLFTHLLPDEARAYLVEIRRVLAVDGKALVTAFLFDGQRFASAHLPGFPHPRPGGTVRWRRPTRPHAAVAYERRWFLDRIAEAGLTVEHEVAGFYPGEATPPSGQDLLVLRRAG